MYLAIVILTLSLAAVAVFAVEWCSMADSTKNYPPISEKEFLSRCRKGVNPEIALKVRRIVADQTQIEYERIDPNMAFIDFYQ